jgi:hypothetical protein
MDAERARATLAASLVNSWHRGAADVEDKRERRLRGSGWHPDVPNHDISAFIARWDRNTVANCDSDVELKVAASMIDGLDLMSYEITFGLKPEGLGARGGQTES